MNALFVQTTITNFTILASLVPLDVRPCVLLSRCALNVPMESTLMFRIGNACQVARELSTKGLSITIRSGADPFPTTRR